MKISVIAYWRRTRASRARTGVTLTELMVAMVASGFLLAGMMSAIVITSTASDPDLLPAKTLETNRILADLAHDLQFATEFTLRTSNEVEFKLPDRNGDATKETMRYRWFGTSGFPLLRKFNGQPAVPLFDGIEQFRLVYGIESVTEEVIPGHVEGSELGMVGYETAFSVLNAQIDNGQWIGQSFVPGMVPDTISWSVTRVQFQVRSDDLSAPVRVQLRRTSGATGQPFNSVLEEGLVPAASIGSNYAWIEVSFTNVKNLVPGSGLCLVIGTDDSDESCDLAHSSASFPNMNFWNIDPGSGPVSEVTGAIANYRVWGKFTTQGPAQQVTRDYLTTIRLELQPTIDPRTNVRTTVRILNAPEVTGS